MDETGRVPSPVDADNLGCDEETDISGGQKPNFIYCIAPERSDFVKVGRWTGSIIGLKHRYTTYYGKFTVCLFEVCDPVAAERECKSWLRRYHYTNELYDKEAEPAFMQFCEGYAEASISGGEYIRQYICEKSSCQQRQMLRRHCKAAGMHHGAKALVSAGHEREALLINESVGDEGVDLVVFCLTSVPAEHTARDRFAVKAKAIHEVVTALGLRHILDHKTEFSVQDRKDHLLQTGLFRQQEQLYRIFNTNWKKPLKTSEKHQGDATDVRVTTELRFITDRLRCMLGVCHLKMVSRRDRKGGQTRRFFTLSEEDCKNVTQLAAKRYNVSERQILSLIG